MANDAGSSKIQSDISVKNYSYILDSEDKLKITVFEEASLSDTYSIDGSGYISMPLIGEVKLAGLTLRQAENLIIENLKNGYLIDPSIVIEVASYRPFYILGEVRSPGRYAYVSHISALKAVALAGGFTYRANRKEIEILRAGHGASEESAEEVAIDAQIYPGDIITVKERFF